MTDDEVRRWAAMWSDVDWSFDEAPSDADLAEAVRKKFFDSDAELVLEDAHRAVILIVDSWVRRGPLAFIRAVREVIDD